MKHAALTCIALSFFCLFPLETVAQRRLPNGMSIPKRRQILPERREKACSEEDRHDLLERAERAALVMREFMDAPDRGMPQAFLDRSNCVAVVPSMKKGGFGFGGQWGRGLLSCRYENKAWSPPIFFTVTGGSFGLQIGLEVTDLIMIISTRSGLNSLLQNKVELGAGAGVTALLFGRNVGVSSDPLLDARAVSYSRSRGLYAGLDLRGAYFKVDDTANCILYGERSKDEPFHTHDILARETLPNTPEGLRATELSIFSRTLKEISPAKVVYVKVPRSRLQQPPAQIPPAQTPPARPAGS
jgi:lipid-binding SYLF domain-containing protein